jgi:2-dehydropantoate 2-reductase
MVFLKAVGGNNMCKIAIWGSGAIGGTIGARLVRAGEEILLVDTVESHIETMNRKGLFIEDDGKGFHVKVKALLPEELKPPLDLVFLAVKAHHTLDAVKMMKPLVEKNSTVVSLQNGLNEELIAEQIGRERTMGALVNFSADYIAPGHILYGGEGSLILGELNGKITERLKQISALLNKAILTKMTDNLWGYKWSKVCYGALLVATALVDEPVYEIVLRSKPIQEMFVALVCELLKVANARQIKIEPFDEFLPELFWKALGGDQESLRKAMNVIANHYKTQTKGKTGIWRDLAVKRRKTEVEVLIGGIVRKGEAIGLQCPIAQRLIQLIHEIEDGKCPMKWENLDELIKVHRAEVHCLR